MTDRPIDAAMAEVRPAKRTIRAKWVEVCREWLQYSDHEPLYVTLPGSDGLDIALLIEEGIIPVLESGAIPDKAAGMTVAIEKDVMAAAKLRARYPGLKVLYKDIANELKVQHVVTDLSKEAQQFGRGLVINLDFNQPLVVSNDAHPTLDLVDRLADVHRHKSVQDWTLLLTLNVDTSGWPPALSKRHANMLDELLRSDAGLQSWWQKNGRDLAPVLSATESFADWSRPEQQRLVLILVPFLILARVNSTGWDINTLWSAAYGGGQRQAAMATWVIDFIFDRDACAALVAQRRQCAERLLAGIGTIDQDGLWLPLN